MFEEPVCFPLSESAGLTPADCAKEEHRRAFSTQHSRRSVRGAVLTSSQKPKNIKIENAEIEFKSGLNTITGETGAGKSILLDCISFVLGWNSRSDLLRKTSETGEVVAEFLVPENHITLAILDEADIPASKPLIIIRRTISDQGKRKRVYLNDRVVSLEFLKSILFFRKIK